MRLARRRGRGVPERAGARGLQQRAARPRSRPGRARRGRRRDGGGVRVARRRALRRVGARERRGRCAPTERPRLHARRVHARDGHGARRHLRSRRPSSTSRRRTGPSTWRTCERRRARRPAQRRRPERVSHARGAARDGESVATAMAFDHDGDCGIYNVVHARGGAAPRARHRAHRAARPRRRRARLPTASLQSTAMAERVYAAVGFRDLGRILEYVP